jgi:hypothetical protein
VPPGGGRITEIIPRPLDGSFALLLSDQPLPTFGADELGIIVWITACKWLFVAAVWTLFERSCKNVPTPLTHSLDVSAGKFMPEGNCLFFVAAGAFAPRCCQFLSTVPADTLAFIFRIVGMEVKELLRLFTVIALPEGRCLLCAISAQASCGFFWIAVRSRQAPLLPTAIAFAYGFKDLPPTLTANRHGLIIWVEERKLLPLMTASTFSPGCCQLFAAVLANMDSLVVWVSTRKFLSLTAPRALPVKRYHIASAFTTDMDSPYPVRAQILEIAPMYAYWADTDALAPYSALLLL